MKEATKQIQQENLANINQSKLKALKTKNLNTLEDNIKPVNQGSNKLSEATTKVTQSISIKSKRQPIQPEMEMV